MDRVKEQGVGERIERSLERRSAGAEGAEPRPRRTEAEGPERAVAVRRESPDPAVFGTEGFPSPTWAGEPDVAEVNAGDPAVQELGWGRETRAQQRAVKIPSTQLFSVHVLSSGGRKAHAGPCPVPQPRLPGILQRPRRRCAAVPPLSTNVAGNSRPVENRQAEAHPLPRILRDRFADPAVIPPPPPEFAPGEVIDGAVHVDRQESLAGAA